VPEGNDAPLDGKRGFSLRWLDVDDAVLTYPAAVAAYLFAMFPRVDDIVRAQQDRVGAEVQEQADILHTLWMGVGRLYSGRGLHSGMHEGSEAAASILFALSKSAPVC
jgi:hypothetical protein